MDEGTAIIAERVAEEMRNIRRERAKATSISILTEAYSILEELGEHDLSTALRAAGKRLGSKLKTYGTNH